MNPKDILVHYDTSKAHATDNEDLETSRLEAIKAIKDYARKMCDEQKKMCISSYCDEKLQDEQDAIANAPYPKELRP